MADTRPSREHAIVDRAAAGDLERQARINQHTLAATDDGVVVMARANDFAVVECNSAFARMLGFDAPEDVIGLHPWDWDVNATREDVHAMWPDPQAAFAPVSFETRHRRRDGTIYDAEVGLSSFQAGGEAFGFSVVRDITELKRASAERDAAEFRIRLATESAGIGIWEWDTQTDRVETCRQYCAVLGLAPGAIATGEDWIARIHPEDMDNFLRQADSGLAPEGDGFRIELRVRHGDGSYRWISDSCRVAERDKFGKPLRLVGTIRNIDERKQAEHRLREREELLSAILDHVPGAVVLVDEDSWTIVQFNDHAARMHGMTRDEFAGCALVGFKVDLPVGGIEERRQKVISEGAFDFEDVHRRKDGSTFDVHIRTRRIQIGGVRYALALWTDISERKRAQRELLAAREEMRSLVENSPDGMIRYDRSLRRVYVNAAMSNFIGGDARKIRGRTVRKPARMREEDQVGYVEALKETFREGAGRQVEVSFEGPASDWRWGSVNFSPEVNDSGEIETVLATVREITEIVAHRERLHQLAYNDPLTGLANRAGFSERFTELLARTRQASERLALLTFDLDRFKDVNDSLGHAAGDDLLAQMGARLVSSTRRGDILARLGGDEFAMLLTDLQDQSGIEAAIECIKQCFLAPFRLNEREVFTSAAIGIALYPDDGETADGLLAHADAAMYSAKAQGRGGVQFYTRELSKEAELRLALLTDIKNAVGNGELELVYQPKICLGDVSCVGAEALLRWNHPDRGQINPDAFIPVAEETGAIVEIGRWVLAEACRAAAEWNARAGSPLRIAVNLSGRQFVNNDVASDIRAALTASGCCGKWLECEITESLMLSNDESVHGALAEIAEMGVTVAIDDFGTGQSALSYLNRFHVDVLKIDRSFVSDMEIDWRKAELVKAFISIATALDMETVAEGVETSDQARILLRLGCTIGQGFHFSRPMTKMQFQARYVEGVLAPEAV